MLNVIAAVRTNINSASKQNEIDIGAGFADIFSVDFSKSTNYAKFKQASSLDVRNLSVGVVPTGITVETLQEINAKYLESVKTKPGLVTLVFSPYSSIGGEKASTVPNLTAAADASLQELARKKDRTRTLSNDLELANDAIARGVVDYLKIDGKPEDARKLLEEYLSLIAQAVDVCRRAVDPDDCVKAIKGVGPVPASRVSRV